MQVDSDDILWALDAELLIYTNEEFEGTGDVEKIQEEKDYIEDVLEKNHIEYDGGGDYNYQLGGQEILEAVKAFGLEVGDFAEIGDEGHTSVDLEGNDKITATLYLTFNDDTAQNLASWLIDK